MADTTTQKALHKFLADRLLSLDPFTKEDIRAVTGWSDTTLETYWSKQLKGYVESVDEDGFRVRERFRPFLSWKKFRGLVTQVKSVKPNYTPTTYDEIIIYEFYIPLAHEQALRLTLDSLFYKDALLPRLKRIGLPALRKLFSAAAAETDDALLERVCAFVEEKFGGYSIYHVDGRFRAGKLSTQQQVAEIQQSGQQYLVDETTAVTRFIFPCSPGQAEKVRFLFRELFTNGITDLISGEDEIWIAESGQRNEIQIWKPTH